MHFLQHAAIELRRRLVHSRRIDKDDLRRRMDALARFDFHDSGDAIARRLGLGRDDRNLLACERVQQRALARIRAAEDGDES